jgi:hypothetical protein
MKTHIKKSSRRFLSVTLGLGLVLCLSSQALAHCDTLDGPVIQDARKALSAKDVTPVLKWVSPHDEQAVKKSFAEVLAVVGTKNADAKQQKLFEDLVRIHRAGEGAPFTGLKPAEAVEPAVAEADKALISGSSATLVKLMTDSVTSGIIERYERTFATYQHKDESVAAGREFVRAYVEYTHYVERLHMDATAKGEHREHLHMAPASEHHGDPYGGKTPPSKPQGHEHH